MTDDLSTADVRQLKIWAYGRDETATGRARADAALLELARRANVARDAAKHLEVEQHGSEQHRSEQHRAEQHRAEQPLAEHAMADRAADGEAEHSGPSAHSGPSTTEGTRRRRYGILAAGIASLAVAALAFAVTVVVFTPADLDSDPLAIFERTETQADRDWVPRLVGLGLANVYTEGPRAVELGDGFVAIATRVSTVPDGRSTDWDSVCLAVSSSSLDAGAGSLSFSCTYPERFEREGLTFAERPTQPGTGFDTVIWGPTGGPRLERNVPLEGLVGSTSVLDYMAFPPFVDPDADSLPFVAEPTRLLMGPVAIALDPGDQALPAIDTSTYLLQGRTDNAEPLLCAVATVPDARATRACATLQTVRRQGLTFTVVADARPWVVSIGADGPDRRDTLRATD